MRQKSKFARVCCTAFVLSLVWTATASADISEAVPNSKGHYYQKVTNPKNVTGMYAISASATLETTEGSGSDACHIFAVGTVLLDSTGQACAWANIQVVGSPPGSTLCPALPENQILGFSGPYTVNADGSVTALSQALGFAPNLVTFLPSLDTNSMVFSCQDLDNSSGDSGANKSWFICSGSAVKINKNPKMIASGGTCNNAPTQACQIDAQCPTGGKCTGAAKVPATCAGLPQ